MRPQTFIAQVTSTVTAIANFVLELAQRLVEDDGMAARLQPVRVVARRPSMGRRG